jgi:hypothetical protein
MQGINLYKNGVKQNKDEQALYFLQKTVITGSGTDTATLGKHNISGKLKFVQGFDSYSYNDLYFKSVDEIIRFLDSNDDEGNIYYSDGDRILYAVDEQDRDLLFFGNIKQFRG